MNWIIAHPDAATALATMALVAVGLVIGAGQIAVVWYGISRMVRAGDARERQQERRHREVMEEGERRHKEATDALAEERRLSEERSRSASEDGERRHREAMEDGERRHKEAMETLAAQRRALEALIERTAPPPAAPAE